MAPSDDQLDNQLKETTMKPETLVLPALIALFMGAPAFAGQRINPQKEHVTPGDDTCIVPMAQWQPRDRIRQMARERGWTIRRLKTDDGCYEIKGRDERGVKFEALVDPRTMEVVSVEYDNEAEGRNGKKARD